MWKSYATTALYWLQRTLTPPPMCAQTVLKRFGHLEDPLMEGHLLLDQYQAHFVSALR